MVPDKAKLHTFRSNNLHYHSYLPEVDVQIQKGQEVLGSITSDSKKPGQTAVLYHYCAQLWFVQVF